MAANKTVAGLVEYFVRTYSMPQKTAESVKRNPTLRLMKRDDRKFATGEAFHVTIKTHQAYSGSHTFADGMADEGSSQPIRWLVSSPKTLYGRLTFDALLLAQQTLGALIPVKSEEMNDVADGMLTRLEKKLWSDAYDDLMRITPSTGFVSGTSAEYVISAEQTSDIYNLMYGMYVQGFSTRETAATAPRTDVYQVTKLDPANGQATITRVSGSANDLATGDYLFVRGDRNTTSGGLSFPGITAFIPSTDPTTDLLGVVRTGHGAFRSGWRLPFTGKIKDTIKKSFSIMGRFVVRPGARFTVCLSAGDWYRLENELEGEIIRNPQAQQIFGTESIMVRTMWGLVDCITIPVLRDGRMYYIDWSTWTLHHLKGLPHIIDDDGLVALRLGPGSPTGNTTQGDGIEIRWRMWVHPVCDFPIANGTSPTV